MKIRISKKGIKNKHEYFQHDNEAILSKLYLLGKETKTKSCKVS
jgi:predicted nucleotidyltransferase